MAGFKEVKIAFLYLLLIYQYSDATGKNNTN